MVFRVALGLPFLVRAAVAIALVAPLGVTLGMAFGFTTVIALAGACYLIAWVTLERLSKRQRTPAGIADVAR